MTDPNRAESESRTVDALLSDFFRAERPKVWPPAPPAPRAGVPAPVAPVTVPSELAGKRTLGHWLTRGRATLAGSVAFLLVAGLAVTPDLPPRPAAPAPATGPGLLRDSSAKAQSAKPPGAPKPGEVLPQR